MSEIITLPYGNAPDGVEYSYAFRNTPTPSMPRGIPYTGTNFYAHTVPVARGIHTLPAKLLQELSHTYFNSMGTNTEALIVSLPTKIDNYDIHWYKVMMHGYKRGYYNNLALCLMPLLQHVVLHNYQYDVENTHLPKFQIYRNIFARGDVSSGAFWFRIFLNETQKLLLLENQNLIVQPSALSESSEF